MNRLLQELHHPGVRCSRDQLAQLLHRDFHEVGRSGRAYNRETVINFLAAQASQPVVASEAFSVSELPAQGRHGLPDVLHRQRA
jgi:hypothetical protein